MRKIVISMSTGYVGMDAWDFYEVSEQVTDKELDDLAWQCAVNHAESYGIYPSSDYEDTEDEDEYGDKYSDNIEGSWEEYIPKKHDQYTIGDKIYWAQY